MKKRILAAVALLLVSATVLTACGSAAGSSRGNDTTVVVGITGDSENAIWAPVIEKLAEEGITLEVRNFADFTLLNRALNDGELDLNAFQHHLFLNQDVLANGFEIEAIANTYISAMCIYSANISSIDELQDGDKIAIPNDPSNMSRALTVAQGAGIIDLNTEPGELNQITNIAENPLNIEFVPVDAAMVYAMLPDVAAGIINGNFALDAGLSPIDDSIFYDDVHFYEDDSYFNLIAARTEDRDNEVFQRVIAAYQSDAVKRVYETDFKGTYIPTWE